MAPAKALALLWLLFPLLSESVQICLKLMEVMNEFLTQSKSIYMDSVNSYKPTRLEVSTALQLKDCVDETITLQEGNAIYQVVEQINDICVNTLK